MTNSKMFVVIPYLKTSERVKIGNITFWPSQEVNNHKHLDLDDRDHLKTLFTLFYLRGESRISQMLYACIDLGETVDPEQIFQSLRDAQTLLGYFYSSPHPTNGEPFLGFENASLYLFRADQVSRFLVEEVADKDLEGATLADTMVPGYEGILNWHLHFWVTQGSRIYPPIPHLILNRTQDAHRDLERLTVDHEQWPFRRLLSGGKVEDDAVRDRIFTALEWYSRCCLSSATEDVALLHLAVAFETLLKLEEGDKLTDRFVNFIQSLLGKNAYLEAWAEQFYDARSKIVHQGSWPHLNFYAVNDPQLYKKILKGQQQGIVNRSLIAYGRMVFRICLQTILFSIFRSQDSDLPSSFVHDQDRLRAICENLRKPDIEAAEKLRQVYQHVSRLDGMNFGLVTPVTLESVIGTGKLVAETCRQAYSGLPDEVEHVLRQISQPASKLPQYDHLLLFQQLFKLLQQLPSGGMSDNALESVKLYAQYASSPMFLLRTDFGGKSDSSDEAE